MGSKCITRVLTLQVAGYCTCNSNVLEFSSLPQLKMLLSVVLMVSVSSLLGTEGGRALLTPPAPLGYRAVADDGITGVDTADLEEMLGRPQTVKWELLRPRSGIRGNSPHLEDILEDDHVVVPKALIWTHKILHQGSNCSKLQVDLHSNTITPAMLLHPLWIVLSPSLGSCPTMYNVRHLGSDYSPSALLEAECPCEGSPCSSEGHQCVPVSRQIPVWHRQSTDGSRSLTLQEMVVGCVCLMRPGLMADYIVSPWLQN